MNEEKKLFQCQICGREYERAEGTCDCGADLTIYGKWILEEPGPEPPEPDGLLRQVLALPKDYRTVVHLFYYEELSTAEIAKLLGKREGAVRTRLSRARAMLREALKEDDDVSERL